MKKLSLFKVLPLIAVALVGVAIAASCEKDKEERKTDTQNPPDISQTDTTVVNPNHRIVLSLTPDSIRSLLLGSWEEKYYGWHSYYDDDDVRDTLTFIGNDSTVLDKTGIFSNWNFSVLDSNTIQLKRDSVFQRDFDFVLSIDTTTNKYEILFYNFINLSITCVVKNIPYIKLK